MKPFFYAQNQSNLTMERRRLGKTKIEVTPIGLGTWQFSEGKGGAMGTWDALSAESTTGIINAALDGGINWFDTAEMYGFGRSERGLSRGLQAAGKADGEVVIATKWRPFLRTASSIGGTIDERLSALRPYHIDLHQIHFPLSFSSVKAEMDAMADLIDEGKIRAAGVSNYGAGQMRRAHDALAGRGFPLASNQVKYSLLDRGIEANGILDAAKELGVTIIAYSPLEMGLLSGKYHKDPKLLKSLPLFRRMRLSHKVEKSRPLIGALEEIALRAGASASQVALNWLVNYHGESVVTIPGATKTKHAVESAGAMSLKLAKDDLSRIDELSNMFK
jgi:aryl-alcohol dehydrogenase-like predicted oxidoreductase